MFKNLKIAHKLAAGFGIVLLLALPLSSYTYLEFAGIELLSQEVIQGQKYSSLMLEKEIDHLKAKMATESAEAEGEAVQTINNTKVLIQKVTVDNPAALRDLADRLKEKIKSGVVVLGSVSGAKAFLIVVVTKDLTDRFHAGNVIKQIAGTVGGSGGGRPDMAQAGDLLNHISGMKAIC